jgi:DNA-binding CsgD family transcriptional regulator
VLASSGAHSRAAQLFGALEARRESLGLCVIYRDDDERGVAAARAGLGARAFAALWSRGRALTREEAVELAPAAPDLELPGGLTEREVEVLAQEVQGPTNDPIAARLFLGSRTGNWHLTAVYRELAVRSRTAAVRFASSTASTTGPSGRSAAGPGVLTVPATLPVLHSESPHHHGTGRQECPTLWRRTRRWRCAGSTW